MAARVISCFHLLLPGPAPALAPAAAAAAASHRMIRPLAPYPPCSSEEGAQLNGEHITVGVLLVQITEDNAGGEWLINHTFSSFQQFWGILARGTHDPSRCLHAVCLWLERSFVLAALLPGLIECSIAHIVRSLRQLPVH